MKVKDIIEENMPSCTTNDLQESGSDSILVKIYLKEDPTIQRTLIIKDNTIVGSQG